MRSIQKEITCSAVASPRGGEHWSPFRPAAGREEIAAKQWWRIRACRFYESPPYGWLRAYKGTGTSVLSPARSRRAYTASRQASFSDCHCNCSTLILPKKYRLKRTLSPPVRAIVVRFLRNARPCQRTPLSRNGVYIYIRLINGCFVPRSHISHSSSVRVCDPR